MNSATPGPNRTEQIDRVSSQLLSHVALLTRLLARRLRGELSRTEAGLLNTVSAGPRRITELAEFEGLAQPTTTLLVKRLEERGLVRRRRPVDDGRVVLVELTPAGRGALDDFRAQAAAILRGHLAEMSDDQIAALDATTETMAALVSALQRTGPT